METTIHVRVENETRDAIQRIAADEQRTFSQAARVLLREAIDARSNGSKYYHKED